MLTYDNYYESKVNERGFPYYSASAVKYALPSEGGSLARLQAYLEKDVEDSDTKARKNGKILHKWLENKALFGIDDGNLPDEWIQKTIDSLLSSLPGLNASSLILQSAEHIGAVARQYTSLRWGDAAFYKNVVEKGSAYLQHRLNNDGKIMITAEQRDKFNSMQSAIENSQYSELILGTKIPGAEVIWSEHPIDWNYKFADVFIAMKSLIDRFWINTTAKEYTILDYKTTSSPIPGFISTTQLVPNVDGADYNYVDIPGPMLKYRYYRQMAIYDFAVRWFLRNVLNIDLTGWKRNVKILAIQSIEPFELGLFDVNMIDFGHGEFFDSLATVKDYYKLKNIGTF